MRRRRVIVVLVLTCPNLTLQDARPTIGTDRKSTTLQGIFPRGTRDVASARSATVARQPFCRSCMNRSRARTTVGVVKIEVLAERYQGLRGRS